LNLSRIRLIGNTAKFDAEILDVSFGNRVLQKLFDHGLEIGI
jgi:hypothetical protein